MIRKFNIISVSLLLFIYILILNFINLVSAEKTKITAILANLENNKMQIQKNFYLTIETVDDSKTITVDFWKLDPDNKKPGDYLGSATLKRGILTIDIKDKNLVNILNNPYMPVAELTEEGTARDWKVKYGPGTASHLQSIARDSWRWNYLSKIETITAD
ncbi:MAG: hypothetical protein PHQ54_02905 [Candidatus Omnitrophica bacterium]|nr:hypothetical protein [Candidatus Omnitrophota bacterium]